MLILLDPSELSPALLYSVKNLVQHPKAESSLVDPMVSSMTTTLPFDLGAVYFSFIPQWNGSQLVFTWKMCPWDWNACKTWNDNGDQ